MSMPGEESSAQPTGGPLPPAGPVVTMRPGQNVTLGVGLGHVLQEPGQAPVAQFATSPGGQVFSVPIGGTFTACGWTWRVDPTVGEPSTLTLTALSRLPAQPNPDPTVDTATGAPDAATTGRRKWPRWAYVTAGAVLGMALAVGGISSIDHMSSKPSVSTSSVPASNSTTGWTQVAASVSPQVVTITADLSSSGEELSGSGTVSAVSGSSATIITNNHVVSGADTITVTFADGTMAKGTVKGADAQTDIAVIQVPSGVPSSARPATFQSPLSVSTGESVMALGAPLGLSQSASAGIVSAVNRPVVITTSATTVATDAIQIDAPGINHGSSGGPVFNTSGQVIGIVSSMAGTTSSDDDSTDTSTSGGIGFAIPAPVVTSVADQLLAHGSVVHGWLGVQVATGTADVSGQTRAGAQVKAVTSGGPAATAGLKVGDTIMSMNGQSVSGGDGLLAQVRSLTSGTSVTVVYVRDGQQHTATTTLTQQPS